MVTLDATLRSEECPANPLPHRRSTLNVAQTIAIFEAASSEQPLVSHDQATDQAARWTGTMRERLSDIITDWTSTGKGSHVDFDSQDTLPIKEGRFLGRGAMGDVYETKIRGIAVAWKKLAFTSKIDVHERREIEILKKLSHPHMVKLVGTYTYRHRCGILLHPVAVCDLHTYLEDIEAHWNGTADKTRLARLKALACFPDSSSAYKASPIYAQIGCLVSAISYLHKQKIRHKDLKPSNILLSRNCLYLSDFGTATDFSMLSQSATDNERGTPRYFAPEVAMWEPNGRAADMFSLGCVILEILVLHCEGSLERLRINRSVRSTAFHENLIHIDFWLAFHREKPLEHPQLLAEVRSMLSKDPRKRPTAKELLVRLSFLESTDKTKDRLFGSCCRTTYVTSQELEKQMQVAKREVEAEMLVVRNEVEDVQRKLDASEQRGARLESELRASEKQIVQLETQLHNEQNASCKEIESLTVELKEARGSRDMYASRESEIIQMRENAMQIEANAVRMEQHAVQLEAQATEIEARTARMERRALDSEEHAVAMSGKFCTASNALKWHHLSQLDATLASKDLLCRGLQGKIAWLESQLYQTSAASSDAGSDFDSGERRPLELISKLYQASPDSSEAESEADSAETQSVTRRHDRQRRHSA